MAADWRSAPSKAASSGRVVAAARAAAHEGDGDAHLASLDVRVLDQLEQQRRGALADLERVVGDGGQRRLEERPEVGVVEGDERQVGGGGGTAAAGGRGGAARGDR